MTDSTPINIVQQPIRLSPQTGDVKVYNSDGSLSFTILSANSNKFGIINYWQGLARWSNILTNTTSLNCVQTSDLNTYVAASITAASIIYNQNMTTNFTSSFKGGSSDAILVKYNPEGNAEWVATIGSAVAESALGVSIDTQNNILVYGTKSATAVANTVIAYNRDGTAFADTIDNTVNQNNNVFVVKYNSDGFVQGIAALKGVNNQNIQDIHVNLTNEIYIVANSDVPTPLVLTNGTIAQAGLSGTGRGSGYLLKLTNIGNNVTPTWWAVVGTIPTGPNPALFSYARSDSNNNVYTLNFVGGNTAGALYLYDANTTTPIKFTVQNTTARGMMMAKYNSSGIVQWGFNLLTSSMFNQSHSRMCIDSSNNVYIILRVTNTPTTVNDIANINISTTFPAGSTDVQYLIKYTSEGVYQAYAQITSGIVNNMFSVSGNKIRIDLFFTNVCQVNHGTNADTVKTYGASGNRGNILLEFNSELTPSLVGYCTI